MNISWCKVDVNVSVSVTIIRTWIWNSSHIDGCLLRFFHVPNTFWWLLNFERYVHVYVSFRCIFLICSCHLSKHPSICELFHIQVLMMVTETETLMSTLHHDIFTYLDYIFSCNLHTVGFYPYLLSYIYIYILGLTIAMSEKLKITKPRWLCVYALLTYYHYRQGVPTARITLIIRPYWLSLLVSPLHGIQCLHRADECKLFAGHPTLVFPCAGLHWGTSLMNSSFLSQLYPLWVSPLVWIVFEIGGEWPCNCCFVANCLRDLFKKQHVAFLYSYYLAFSPGVSIELK